MRIGIDIRFLSVHNSKAGIYQYIYNLVSALLSIDTSNEYVFLSTYAHGKGFRGDRAIPNKLIRRFPGQLSDFFLKKLFVPIEFFTSRIDVFHGPCFFVPMIGCKSVSTVHDLMPLRHPEFLTPELNADFRKKIYSAQKADAIIAVSNFTKQEIIELLKYPEENIRVVYNGISPIFRPIEDRAKIEEIKMKYGVKGPYFLSVGNIEPKKNIETLIRACVKLRNETIYNYPLLVVGFKGWGFQKVWEIVRQYHAEDDTLFTGVVDDEDLPYLYSGAEIFVFPSLFEGFGIPMIEAMACGTPVITSKRTSIPEISSDAAMLVDPLNVEEMAEAMYSVLSNSELREQLVKKGIKRAKDFSWEKTAVETLKLYYEI
jgi:glycosyltransferase involved in cell wall biosynthesis